MKMGGNNSKNINNERCSSKYDVYRNDNLIHTNQNESNTSSSSQIDINDPKISDQLALINDNSNDPAFSLIGNKSALFSSRKPKDAIAGVASGTKSLVKGIAAGAIGLVTLPIIGAYNEGAIGFAKGAATGITTAVVMPVTGAAVAFMQVGRGIVNTPSAVVNKTSGKKWNRKTQTWEEPNYSLSFAITKYIENPNPWESYIKQNQNHSITSSAETEKVVDSSYYEILQVSVTASKEEIRRQYYKLAKENHPDKNQGDEEAKVRFQEIGKAYQVLSDDQLRSEYNKNGKDATQNVSSLDFSAIFTALFGSEQLEEFTGKSKAVMMMEYSDLSSKPPKNFEEFMEFEFNKRYVLIAIHLRDLVTPFITVNDNEKDAWRVDMHNLAFELCSSSFGFTLIDAIGWSYVNTATQYLGEVDTFLGYGGKYAKMKARFRNYGNKYSTARTVISALSKAQKAQWNNNTRKKKGIVNKFKSSKEVNPNNEKNEETKNEFDGIHNEYDIPKSTSTHKPTKANSPEQKDNSFSQESDSFSYNEQANMAELLPKVLEILFSLLIDEVETVSKKSTKKLLRDEDVELSVRRQRAEAMIELGDIFQSASKSWILENKTKMKPKLDESSAMDILQQAFIRVAERQNNMEEQELKTYY